MRPPSKITIEIEGKKFFYVLATNNEVISQSQKSKFRNTLSKRIADNHKRPKRYQIEYPEQLKLLSEWTEEEFYRLNGISKLVVDYAKKELESVGLTFKQELNN